MAFKPKKTWDNFYGTDPLAGRVNYLTITPYPKTLYTGPISNQNLVNTFQEARALAAKWNQTKTMEVSDIERWMKEVHSPAKLTKKYSLDEKILEKKSSFATVVASNSIGHLQQYCTFCESNREG